MKVLLVEDENALADVIQRNLNARGHQVTTVASAEGAVSSVNEERPDAIVLDVNLPDETGWEVLRRIGPETRHGLRLIVISAAPLSGKRVAEFQPERWFLKPFPLEALMRALVDAPFEEPQQVS